MKILAYLLIGLVCYSCVNKTTQTQVIDPANLTPQEKEAALVKFNFTYEAPIIIDSSDYVLIPISTRASSSKDIRKYASKYDYARYWNILFYNKKSKQTRLLTESKYNISKFDVNIEKTGAILTHSILYTIRDTDYDKNNHLDNDDPQYLFISANDGRQLRRLSPKNENFLSYKIIPNSDQILVQTKRDVNNDLKFDKNDDCIWYEINLQTNEKTIEIIDSNYRKHIEQLYFEQWIKQK